MRILIPAIALAIMSQSAFAYDRYDRYSNESQFQVNQGLIERREAAQERLQLQQLQQQQQQYFNQQQIERAYRPAQPYIAAPCYACPGE